MDKLGFREKNVIATDFSRKNIAYIVKEGEDKLGSMLAISSTYQKSLGEGSGIVYCRERKRCEEVAAFLKESGISADFYHAGLGKEERNLRQEEWKKGKTKIIVSTNAFGMGIDKADVRIVVHIDMPDSLEAYFQEAGRAGRDGLPAWAVLLFDGSDIRKTRQLVSVNFPSTEYMAKVYQYVFNHLQIAYGDGENSIRKFNLMEFARAYGLNAVSAYYAIKYLEQEGYWELTDEIDNPSRIMFLVARDELYSIQMGSSVMDDFVKSLMRTYTGLFSQMVRIDEEYIARITMDTPQNVREKLMALSRQKVIRYIPQIKTPMMIFKCERLTENNLYISPKRYAQRKEQMEKRIEAMIGYATQKANCRSRYMIEYFSQPVSSDCGVCDICISRKKLSDRKIEEEIVSLLNGSEGKRISFLSFKKAVSPALQERYITVLRDMADRGIITAGDDGIYLN